ncbi:glycosyltransferase family 1 protein [Marmoricola sp. URHB0036]|uniref:glycosyltransferase family 4 protein n=1 Tax=Marmoricola sp. URHB0036 TaxID=1298863 RepID=UPI00040BC42E|nr:glycosyltransferase family 1 protein [Marmoricola sp. URHB0036]
MSRTTVFVDVSDLLRHGARTGIQRVVGQVLPRLAAAADDELELLMLRFDPIEHLYLELDTTSMLAVLAGATDEPEVVGRRDIGAFGTTDVFLDLDSAWNSPLKRSTLYPRLKDAGVTIVSYVYDLVPLKVPEVVHETTSANWVVYLSAVLTWSDLVMSDSRSAERDLLDLKEQLDVRRHIPTLVTRLGCDLPEVSAPGDDELALLEPLTGGRFVLFVGTIEPRKEHLVALRAFDEIAEEYPDVHLVLAGRKGWIRDDTVATITGHPSYGERVHWIQAPSDALLAELYRRATACLYLSRYEGYGLPIAEALAHGRVTVASYGSGMPEVGGDACDFVWHNLVPEVAETLAQYLGDPDLLAARERHIRESFRPLSWDTVTRTIEAALRGLPADGRRLAEGRPERLQLVVLGDHPARLRRALAAWGERTDLATELVVVAPRRALARVRKTPTRVPVVPVDRSLLPAGRGWDDPTLPTGLAELDEVDDVFVLLDETHLPSGEVTLDAFVTPEGRMTAYHLGELTRWTRREDDLDERQRATASILGPRGLELLGYAGDRPQVVDKQLLREAGAWADREAGTSRIGGWSAYLDHAVTTHPSLFDKRAVRTTVEPAFERNPTLQLRNERQLRANDLAHGAIRFAGDAVQLLVAGLPQLMTVAEGTHVSLDIAYQLLARGTAAHDIGLSYRVGDGPVHETGIRRRSDRWDSYESGFVSLAVEGTRRGVHDVEFFLQLDGRPVRAAGLRYLATLVVVGADERPVKYYDRLAR